MDTFATIADKLIALIDAVAWPAVVLIFLTLFRSELVRAVKRLSQFKYGDFEATFRQQLEEAEQEAESADLPQVVEPPSEDLSEARETAEITGPYFNSEHFLEVAEASPKAAVLVVWHKVEEAATQAAERLGHELGPEPAFQSAIEALKECPEVNQGIVRLLDHLRRLRNEAAHATVEDFDVGIEEAKTYIGLAARLVQYLSLLEADRGK